MDLEHWNERYLAGQDTGAAPTPLIAEWARRLPPGEALDLACGAGRNALYLAERGWRVTALDGAAEAIRILEERARQGNLQVNTAVADLADSQFRIEPRSWDLILDCYYLQRDLIPGIQAGVRPGGVAIIIVHIPDPGEELSYKRAAPGELQRYFEGWEILHEYAGKPADEAHRRPVAELVARRPKAI
jgi:tellurite methyltransferase